jgi:hypothetical protein
MRPETGALSLALSDTRDRNKALLDVSDSKAFFTTVAGWVGEGKNKSLAQCLDRDILREVVDKLHHSVERGVSMILIKIKSHLFEGELFNELSDRAADNTRLNGDTMISPCVGTVLAGIRFLSGRKQRMGQRCQHAWGRR